MPLIRLDTTETIPADQKAALCQKLSKACAGTIGKPESYQMAVVRDGVAMSFAGTPGPVAFVEVRSIGGLTPEVNRKLAEKVCKLVTETLKIPGERIYLNMLDVPATAWGHDGDTFAGM